MTRQRKIIVNILCASILLGNLTGCSSEAIEIITYSPNYVQETGTSGSYRGTNSSTPNLARTATPFNIETHPPTNTPYRVLEKSMFNLEFRIESSIPPGAYFVSAEESYTHGLEMPVQVMTYSGDLIASLFVELKNGNLLYPTIYLDHIQTGSNQLLIKLGSQTTQELYVFNLETKYVVGIAVTCETLVGTALGAEYLAISCLDDLYTWHFINISDPQTYYSFHIPMPHRNFTAIWVGPSDILFKGKSNSFCLGSIPNWEPICEDFPYWVGRPALDVGLLELREGYLNNPTAVGVLPLDCLRSGSQDCVPIMIENPFNDPQASGIVPMSSSWEPGTKSILYLVAIDHDLSTNVADETELWLATYPEGTMEKLDVLIGEFVLTELGWPDTPAIWLDNGQEIILNKLFDLIIYNIETGEQRSIGNPGVLLGTIKIE